MSRADWRQAKRLRLRRRAARVPLGRHAEPKCAPRASTAGVRVTYKTVDTCAAEFAAFTPYHYGTYEDEDELAPLDAKRS